jgi:hypothetical protein
MKKEAFELLQEVMKEAGEPAKEVPFKDIVDNEFAKNTIGGK